MSSFIYYLTQVVPVIMFMAVPAWLAGQLVGWLLFRGSRTAAIAMRSQNAALRQEIAEIKQSDNGQQQEAADFVAKPSFNLPGDAQPTPAPAQSSAPTPAPPAGSAEANQDADEVMLARIAALTGRPQAPAEPLSPPAITDSAEVPVAAPVDNPAVSYNPPPEGVAPFVQAAEQSAFADPTNISSPPEFAAQPADGFSTPAPADHEVPQPAAEVGRPEDDILRRIISMRTSVNESLQSNDSMPASELPENEVQPATAESFYQSATGENNV